MLAVVVFFTAIASAPVYAGKIIALNPQESKQLTNSSFFTINATCNIQSTKSNNKIRVSVLKNTGTVNGKKLNSGQGTSLSLIGNANISVTAEPGTQISLVNLGNEKIQATCT
jgi:hypothetical protein